MKKPGNILKKFLALNAIVLVLSMSIIVIYAENETPQRGMTYDGSKTNSSDQYNKQDETNSVPTGGKIGNEYKNDNLNELGKEDTHPSKSQDENNDWKKTAFIIAALGAAGVAGGSLLSRNGNSGQGNPKDLTLEGIVPNKNGLWIAPKDRINILKQINSTSAKKYKIDGDGYVILDEEQPTDLNKSMTASNLVDSLINSNTRTIIGEDDKVYKYDGIEMQLMYKN